MNERQQPHAPDHQADRPGKTRTWWHPLLVRLLDHELASAYTVLGEVLVGKLPLRVDILLIRREAGELSEASRRELAALVPLLNRFTLIEFKGPTDALEPGDLAQLVGCAFLWHSQQTERLPRADISLIVLAPTLTDAARDELRCFDWELREHEPGVFEVAGAPLVMWLVETDVMARLGQPILSLVSGVFLKERQRIIEELTRTGHGRLLHYVLQQVAQFRGLGEDFAMQHKDSEYMGELEGDLQTAVLDLIPLEKVLESIEKRLQGLPPEERLRGLPPEERLRGLRPDEVLRRFTPEEFAAGLSEEQAERLRELLERRQGN